jgi:hypothetical protein
MDNQHKKITGYRDLNEEEVAAMNACKAEGERLRSMISEMRSNPTIDQHWVDIAEESLQLGIMAAVRSIAQPDSF